MRKPPQGAFPGEYNTATKPHMFGATGEFRPPKKGEHYLSGAVVHAYRAPNDLSTSYWIAHEVKIVKLELTEGEFHMILDGLGKASVAVRDIDDTKHYSEEDLAEIEKSGQAFDALFAKLRKAR